MLASMLAAHPNIDCGAETFFFARLPGDHQHLTEPDSWPDPAVDYVCSLQVGGEAIHNLYGQSREAIRATLVTADPSLAAMLESLTVPRAAAAGKPRWAEKTPGHLRRVPLIRATFPDASIVRVVRDPRDVAMSMTRVPFASDSLLVDLYACARKDRAAEPKVRRDPRLLTVRYEDLVTDPPAELRRICDFLGETFDPAMAAGGRTRDGVATAGEWWKQNASEAPDASRVEAWRREMAEPDQRAAAVICHDMIVRHDYPGALPIRRIVVIEPEGEAFVRHSESVALQLALGGVVIRRGRSGRAKGGDIVYWPRDGRDPWRLGRRRRAQARRLARMAGLLARRRVARRAAVRVRPGPPTGSGVATRVAGLMLRVLGREMTPDQWLASLGVAAAPGTDGAAPPQAELR